MGVTFNLSNAPVSPDAQEKQMSSDEIGMAIRSFLSETCPACGDAKTVAADPFCEDCLAALPPDLLEAVTDRSTYLDAFGKALHTITRDRSLSPADEPGGGQSR